MRHQATLRRFGVDFGERVLPSAQNRVDGEVFCNLRKVKIGKGVVTSGRVV